MAELLYETPKTLQDAFENQDRILSETTGEIKHINLSDILTILIQDTGRFAERYASDLFITWRNISDLLENPDRVDAQALYNLTEPYTSIVAFGIRESGVDGNSFLMARLKETMRPFCDYIYTGQKYRRVLALKITIEPKDSSPNNSVTCELKDITHQLYRLNPEDK